MPSISAEARKHLRARRSNLDIEFNKRRTEYTDCIDYALPEYGRDVIQHNADREERTPEQNKILDSTATKALHTGAAGLQSGLTSRARPWFKLTTPDPMLNDVHAVKEWLHEVDRVLLWVFARSNFYNSVHQIYYELMGFGTGCMFLHEDMSKVLRCRTYTIGEYRLAMNDKLEVDSIYRTIYMTAGQMVSEFGKDNVSNRVLAAYDRGGVQEKFEVHHAVEPNDDRFDIAAPRRYPWRSIHWEMGSTKTRSSRNEDPKILRASGYYTFPAVAPRWNVVSRNVYGNGPLHSNMPDIKMLMKMREEFMIALAKHNNPPVKAPANMKDIGINTMPGGVNYVDEMSQDALSSLYMPAPDLNAMAVEIEKTREDIRQGLFSNLFLMLANNTNPNMTATEVVKREEEKLTMLGPMIGRFHQEALGPIIDRTFDLALRAGMIPDPPPELEGIDLQVEYISILAQAQKMVGVTSLEQFTLSIGQLMQLQPTVADKVEWDQLVDEFGEALGVPPTVVRSDEEALEAREARFAQQQAMQQMAMAEQAANTAKTASETELNGASVLDQMLG